MRQNYVLGLKNCTVQVWSGSRNMLNMATLKKIERLRVYWQLQCKLSMLFSLWCFHTWIIWAQNILLLVLAVFNFSFSSFQLQLIYYRCVWSHPLLFWKFSCTWLASLATSHLLFPTRIASYSAIVVAPDIIQLPVQLVFHCTVKL